MAQYTDLAGKAVLVTGSSKALGAATAGAFAKQGARVVVHGRNHEAIDRTAAIIRDAGGDCIGFAADLTSAAEVDWLRASIQSYCGDPDILCCFAGGMGRPVSILEMDEASWRRTLDSDLTSKFLTVRAFAPAMQQRRSGSIILMSSVAGRAVSEASAAYGAAQAGTLMLMRHLARELGPAGVRVNAIAPSIVRNEKMAAGMPAELLDKLARTLPLQRIGEPTDVAEATLFLASAASSWITGHVLDVNGGKAML